MCVRCCCICPHLGYFGTRNIKGTTIYVSDFKFLLPLTDFAKHKYQNHPYHNLLMHQRESLCFVFFLPFGEVLFEYNCNDLVI